MILKRNLGPDPIIHFKNSHIPTVHDMIRIALCRLRHNISHKHWPDSIIKLFNRFDGKKQHRYPTRNKHVPNIQRHQSELYKRSFVCGSICENNKLPLHLRQQTNSNIFYRELKQHCLHTELLPPHL